MLLRRLDNRDSIGNDGYTRVGMTSALVLAELAEPLTDHPALNRALETVRADLARRKVRGAHRKGTISGEYARMAMCLLIIVLRQPCGCTVEPSAACPLEEALRDFREALSTLRLDYDSFRIDVHRRVPRDLEGLCA